LNWRLLGFFGIVFVPNLVTLLVGYSGQDLTWMTADRSTLPFGIVTANFINQDLEHFALNMGFLVLFLWGFGVVASQCTHTWWREVVLAGAAILSAIAGISCQVFLGGHGTGSSGIVYATAGVTFGFAIVQRGWIAGLSEGRLNSYAVLASLLIGPSAAFIGGGNAIVHLVALCLGFTTGYGVGRKS
jgi:hypothetical protein